MGFREDVRGACTTMLSGYASAASLKLQVYPGRPRSIKPPTAFVDRISEAMNTVGISTYQRRPTAHIVVLHGLFDSAEAADQADAFVDGFMAWVIANPHAAGANTVIGDMTIDDEPAYTADWIAPTERSPVTYYATLIDVEGFGGF
jgi:hypothetical protein